MLANQLHRYPPPFCPETQHSNTSRVTADRRLNGIENTDLNVTSGVSNIGICGRDGIIEVLELGAGTGVVGLAAAVLWRANVILTDLPSVAPNLAQNALLNADLLSSAGANVSAGALDWSHPSTLVFPNELAEFTLRGATASREEMQGPRKARIIIAADTVYSEEHPADLSNVILNWLEKHEKARLFLCWPLRVGMIDHFNEFWRLLEEGGLVVKEEGREVFEDKTKSSQDEKGGWDDETLHEWSVWGWSSVSF